MLTTDELRSRLAQIKSQARKLGEDLQAAANDLMETGLEPAPALLVRLQEYQSRFQDLASCLPRQSSPLATFRDLETAIERGSRLDAAMQIVATAERLRHQQEPAFRPIEHVQSECQSLRVNFATSNPPWDAAQELVEGRHPLAALVRLATQSDDIPDDRWEELRGLVETKFGRELATAVVRGRVTAAAV